MARILNLSFRAMEKPSAVSLFRKRILLEGYPEKSHVLNSTPSWLTWQRIHLQCWRHGFNPWIRDIPLRWEWQPTPVFLPGEFHQQRSPVGYSPWGRKELDMIKPLTYTHTHTHTYTHNIFCDVCNTTVFCLKK